MMAKKKSGRVDKTGETARARNPKVAPFFIVYKYHDLL